YFFGEYSAGAGLGSFSFHDIWACLFDNHFFLYFLSMGNVPADIFGESGQTAGILDLFGSAVLLCLHFSRVWRSKPAECAAQGDLAESAIHTGAVEYLAIPIL